MILTTAQLDRGCGVLLGTAAGDALGAPYEFQGPRRPELAVEMVGGGGFGWEPGEWTDDTSMAIAIAEVAATGADLRSDDAQDQLVARWVGWARNAPDVGIQTRSVLSSVGKGGAVQAREAARSVHERTGRSGGNGSLMRTAPVALAFLDDVDGLVEAATALSGLTHFDPEAGEACVLWCLAIRHAVLTGELNIRAGLDWLPTARREVWAHRITVAEASKPADFANNGWVVAALQAAWCAISTTAVPVDDPGRGCFRADHLRLGLDAAVRAGNDTDTVAAIAGGVLGAAHGASAVPAAWRRVLHGWPGLRARELTALASAIVRGGQPDDFDYTYANYHTDVAPVRHPYDDGLWLGSVAALRALPPDVDAVVSLCRIGDTDLPSGAELVEVRLVDRDGPDENPNLGFALNDTARVIEQLRAEGHTVLLHCVQAHSRTPAVAALYGARRRHASIAEALAAVCDVLPGARPIDSFRTALLATQLP